MRLRLIVGETIIADSATDGLTRWLTVEKPSLNLYQDSVEVLGSPYARQISRAYGIALSFSVVVGRQFADYGEAEIFAVSHISQFSKGLRGMLKCAAGAGRLFGYRNAALESVEIDGEIGVSTSFKYSFKCAAPLSEFDSLIVVNGAILKIGDYFPVAKIKG